MGRKIYITEEQYKKIMREGVSIDKIQVQANTGNGKITPEEAIKDTEEKIKNTGANPSEYQINVNTKTPGIKMVSDNSSNNGNVSETKFITKKQLQENRLKALKENSELYTLKDFIKNFK